MTTPAKPPYSIEAEQAVLGGLMLDNRIWDDLAPLIQTPDFYRQDHRLIYSLILDLFKSDRAVDFVTLSNYGREKGVLEECGGLSYLGSLVADLGSTAHILSYAEIIREKSILRELASASSDILHKTFHTAGVAVDQILDESEQKIFEVRQKRLRGKSNCRLVSELVPEFEEQLKKLSEKNGMVPGLPTGFSRLDDMTKGLHPGDLVIVAGRPGMGKTSFAMNIAEHAAFTLKIPTVFFSMEMSSQQLFVRVVSSLGRIDQGHLRSGELDDREWDRLVGLTPQLTNVPLYIDESAALSPLDLKARVRQIARKQTLGLVVVDYLQLMQIPGTRENRTNEMSEISRGLKALAKEMRLPVIALSQLNRALESRDNKRPRMSDLRESGGIEQDADLILFLHRESYHNKEAEDKSLSEIIVAKHRNGPTGDVPVSFNAKYTRYDEIAGYES